MKNGIRKLKGGIHCRTLVILGIRSHEAGIFGLKCGINFQLANRDIVATRIRGIHYHQDGGVCSLDNISTALGEEVNCLEFGAPMPN